MHKQKSRPQPAFFMCTATSASGFFRRVFLAAYRIHQNQFNLTHDFNDEISMYLHNDEIKRALDSLALKSGEENIVANVRTCWELLKSMGHVTHVDIDLLNVFLDDLAATA